MKESEQAKRELALRATLNSALLEAESMKLGLVAIKISEALDHLDFAREIARSNKSRN